MGWGWDLFLVKKETNPVKIIRGKENKAFRLGVGEGVGAGVWWVLHVARSALLGK